MKNDFDKVLFLTQGLYRLKEDINFLKEGIKGKASYVLRDQFERSPTIFLEDDEMEILISGLEKIYEKRKLEFFEQVKRLKEEV